LTPIAAHQGKSTEGRFIRELVLAMPSSLVIVSPG
jgi:hypothetical protein